MDVVMVVPFAKGRLYKAEPIIVAGGGGGTRLILVVSPPSLVTLVFQRTEI